MLSLDRWLPFEEAVFDRTRLVIKIQRSDYLTEGKIPVIDQGQEDISGYTSEPNAAYPGPLPVVLFGDHTRALKFVDRPFAAGADGVKVLEPSSDLDAKFLWYYLRSRRLPNDGYSRHFKHLRKLRVPIPPAAEQRRVVDLLSRAENIVRMRREAEQKAKEIILALFLEMFGDPATNPNGWGVTSLGQVIDDFRYGSSQKSSVKGDPVLRIPNVIGGNVDIGDLKFLEVDEADRNRYTLARGDILFVRTNGNPDYVGRCAVFEPPDDRRWLYASYLIRGRPLSEVVDPQFLQVLLSSVETRRRLRGRARTAAGQYNINVEGLRSISVCLPPLVLQRSFATLVRRVKALSAGSATASAMAEASFNSLLAGVFGEIA